MKEYNYANIEQKWQKIWEKTDIYKAKDFDKKPKYYILVEFPYTSGDGLHVGHARSYTALDVLARKKRMQGYNVLYPMGWDAFGLPTENYAIKTGIHPADITKNNIQLFKKQLKRIGFSFDWSREINTTDPKYYKWTQWIFLKIFKKGLAYQSQIPINWCPSCKTGLANEEVVAGSCERCGTEAQKKEQKQWMLKITAYADKLLKDLETVDYLEKIKAQQINWIGKSTGVVANFDLLNHKECINVFTTRIDTLFGVTAIVLAPEHKLVEKIITNEYKNSVDGYIKASKKKSDLERTDLEKKKTGVFTGSYCINPGNNKKIPIWIGDYVIATYGGGAVMVVPAHDKRDYEFAKQYNLDIIEVIKGGDIQKQAYTDYGILVNSKNFNGLDSEKAIIKIAEWLKKNKKGRKTVQYKIRDWVFSRQHYWGEPIPIIHCKKCGVVPVNEKDLPIKLPYVKKYEPTQTGESPLENIKEWVNVRCPKCNSSAKRETDTMPNWAGSNWYFLRYLDSKNNKELAGKKKIKYWMPIDLYNGGMEHTTLHLLYSRFWYKFLYNIGVVFTKEPYMKRRSHGMVLAEDGRKMSKSFGNVVKPDNIIDKYGADVFRIYEMFMGPFDQAIAWNTKTIEGVSRFLKKVWILSDKVSDNANNDETLMHKTIKKVNEDIENMKFNTAIASLMEYVNALTNNDSITKAQMQALLLLLCLFAPHISEELWHKIHSNISEKQSIFNEKYPKYNARLIKQEKIELVIQINGKMRDKLITDINISENQAKDIALKQEKIQKYIIGKDIKRVIFVQKKLINFVI